MSVLEREIRRLRQKLNRLEELKEKEEEAERRRRLIERIREMSGGSVEKIREILEKDSPICLTCGGKTECRFYGGYGVIEDDGKVVLIGYDELDFVCKRDEDHDVVLPSWFSVSLEDFE